MRVWGVWVCRCAFVFVFVLVLVFALVSVFRKCARGADASASPSIGLRIRARLPSQGGARNGLLAGTRAGYSTDIEWGGLGVEVALVAGSRPLPKPILQKRRCRPVTGVSSRAVVARRRRPEGMAPRRCAQHAQPWAREVVHHAAMRFGGQPRCIHMRRLRLWTRRHNGWGGRRWALDRADVSASSGKQHVGDDQLVDIALDLRETAGLIRPQFPVARSEA